MTLSCSDSDLLPHGGQAALGGLDFLGCHKMFFELWVVAKLAQDSCVWLWKGERSSVRAHGTNGAAFERSWMFADYKWEAI